MRAVAVLFCVALFTRAERWAGVSFASRLPVSSGLGWGDAGFAVAGTDWMPTARKAAVETRAPSAIRLRGMRLTRTPPATAAGAAGDRPDSRVCCPGRAELCGTDRTLTDP